MEVGAPQPNAVRCVEQIDRADTHALILSVRGFSQATLRNISNPRNPDGSRFAKLNDMADYLNVNSGNESRTNNTYTAAFCIVSWRSKKADYGRMEYAPA